MIPHQTITRPQTHVRKSKPIRAVTLAAVSVNRSFFSRLPTFSLSHFLTFPFSHLLAFSPAHICRANGGRSPRLSHLLTFSLSHLRTFSPAHIWRTNSGRSPRLSHLLTFSLSHLRTFSPAHICRTNSGRSPRLSHLLTFSLSHLRTFSPSHLLPLTLALLGLLLLRPPSLAPAAETPRRPNVLLLVGDDHSADVLGCYGNTLAQTPSLDRLAAEGIRFDRAYVNAPICTPSRQSFLTGRYPHCTGVTLLNQALPEQAVTLAHRLREAGYRTGAFGKMHFNSNLRHGFEIHLSEADWRKHDAQAPHRPLPPGLDVLGPWKPFQDPARVWLNGFHRPFGRYDDEMSATWFAQRAVEFMTSHKDEPWFVQIGFQEPHSPFWFPVEFAGRFQPKSMVIPDPGPEDEGRIPRIFADLTLEDKQGIKASYYTSVAWLDVNVGRVLDALAKLTLAQDTLVIYLGDNGYHLGEHGRFEKHTLYERCVRVPLIMRLPGRIDAGRSTRALVELVDIVPTVLDYAGIRAQPEPPASPVQRASSPRDLDGQTLRPLIERERESIRDAVFSEYQHTEEVMVRTDRYKLMYRSSRAPTDWYEPIERPVGRAIRLYNLERDPLELYDISRYPGDPAIIDDLLDRLANWYEKHPPVGPPPDAPFSKREDFLDWAIASRSAPTTQPVR